MSNNRFGNQKPFDISRLRGFPPIEKTPPNPAESPKSKVINWMARVPSSTDQIPPPHEELKSSIELETARKEYNSTFVHGIHTGESSYLTSSNCASPFELKLEELKSPLEIIEKQKCFVVDDENKGKEGDFCVSSAIKEAEKPAEYSVNRENSKINHPRLKVPQNYDENPKVAKFIGPLYLKLKKQMGISECYNQDALEEIGNEEGKENFYNIQSCWAAVDKMTSEHNKYEVSELAESVGNSWCICLFINRERTPDKTAYQHLIYSYQCGIQRIILTQTQTDAIHNSLMIKYKKMDKEELNIVPIFSTLPSSGLMSTNYRYNKGIELRVYGIVNFIDFLKDPDHCSRQTMVWTDAVGPIYLTSADRANIRRKSLKTEIQIFAPLRLCQMTIKAEFKLTVPTGTQLKWTITSFQPLIEEASKQTSMGQSMWPARVLRFDDLVVTKNTIDRIELESYHTKAKIVAGPHLFAIINSAGPTYAENGVMMGFVVPCYTNGVFVHYEALIAGPPRVVMIITEGRFLNYRPKTWPPAIKKMCDEYRKMHNLRLFARDTPAVMKPPDHQIKSLKGFNEFHFDFET